MTRLAAHQNDHVLVAINSDAEVFLTLAARISGAAVGWNPGSLLLLSEGIQQRFGELFGPSQDQVASKLIELAVTPATCSHQVERVR